MAVSLEEYFRTTFEDKLLVKMPEREDDHLTPATRLLEKRREMAEVEQALAAQKEEFQMKMESLQQRREELERKEYQLKKSLLQFDKFLKDNDSKKARAVKKANDEREMKRQKEKEIEKLKVETDDFNKNKEKLKRKLENYSVFHKYMEKALERGEEFHEMRDVIARYDTLTATHEDLLKSDQKNQDVIERHRQNLMKYVEEKDNEILGFNNQLSSLQTRLDDAQSDAVKWESQWTHIKNTAAKKTLELGRIKMATHNLYQLVKRHQKQAAGAEETPDQLNQIQMFLEDLTDIVHDLKRQDTLTTSVGPSSS
ncbi:coiled-coil domain-containing protein 42 homolog isoform X2 [Mya arenaria]|uniref:coiled-coil domain-containing protein 42 homolog isoform X2 n=1 Tax=Mya arenaria TaxID=6604 RepID=UPI0022E11E42|nr:coiled-coil domain-containing protein 42 homolog isoform X2 [Mya arenaria]